MFCNFNFQEINCFSSSERTDHQTLIHTPVGLHLYTQPHPLQALTLGPAAVGPPGLSRDPPRLLVEPVLLQAPQLQEPTPDRFSPRLRPAHWTLRLPGRCNREARPPRINPGLRPESGRTRTSLILVPRSEDLNLRPAGVEVTAALRAESASIQLICLTPILLSP